MKIKSVSTDFFAGISNKKINFNDGINVICGDNESGKSTIVNLISEILFQDVKLDKRKDKAFIENAFPADRTDGLPSGKNIDGTIEIETPNGNYKLTKEWGEEPTAKLTTPAKTIKSYAEIIDELRTVLGCDEGTYKEMLLSPQSAALDNLKNLLEGSSETNKTLLEAVSQAFMESDGVPIDKVEAEIEKAIDELVGKCWDIEKGKPVKDYKTKKKSLGELVTMRQELDKAQDDVNKLNELEEAFDAAINDLSQKEKFLKESEKELSDFEKYAGIIRDISINKATAERCKEEIERCTRALGEFPKASDDLKKAQELKSEKDNRILRDCYENSKKAYEEWQKIEGDFKSISRPDDAEIKSVKAAKREAEKLENKLRGMNIAATLRMLGDNTVKITSLLSGEQIKLEGKNAVLTEAVRIEIPGVMEMNLAPADVNTAEIKAQIEKNNTTISEIFGKYKCNSIDELEQLAADYDKLSAKREAAEKNFKISLGDYDFSELESKAKELPDVRDLKSIESDISALCKGEDIAAFIGAKNNRIQTFNDNYGSVEKLKSRISERENELKEAQNKLDSAENIPEKYSGISNPDEYKNKLSADVKAARGAKENALKSRTEAETSLNNFVENNGNDLQEKLEKTNAEYTEKVELLNRWLHIRQVFNEHKAALAANPLDTLVKNFVSHLKEISNGNTTAEFSGTENSDFEITSGNYKLDFSKLSEGSKETVYLAFRLAVLEHLSPDGGGVIVLDDPLANMDPGRVERSCKLIEKFSQRHQIIFLTCRPEYAEKLGVNMIEI